MDKIGKKTIYSQTDNISGAIDSGTKAIYRRKNIVSSKFSEGSLRMLAESEISSEANQKASKGDGQYNGGQNGVTIRTKLK